MLTLKEVRAQYPGAQDLSDDELIDVLANRYGADKFTVMEAIGYKPEAGVFRTAGDMAVKGAQGVVDLGQSVVGLASLATGGKAGEAMRSIGYDPERTNKTLGEFLSTAQQVSENKVQSADGFVNTVATALQNPRAIAGSVAESMPGMFAAGAGSSFMARSIAAKAAAPFGGLTTAKGAAAAKAAVDAAANRLMWAGAAGEGAQTAGQIADQAQGAGRQFTDYAGPALAAGVGTAVIGRAAGKLMGDAETALFTGSAGAGIKGGMAARVGKGIIGEGLLEEMPQSALEQMFTNLAMGKPAMEGVGNAAGMGLVTGAAMGAGMGAIQKDNAPIAERPPAPKRDPIAEIGSAPNLDAAAAAATAAVDEVLNEPAATPPAGPSAFTPPASLTNTAIDFTGGEANNAFMAAARERLAQQTLTGQMPADLMGGLAPANAAVLQSAQVKQEDRRQSGLEDRAMADMERQAARDFSAQRDLQDMPRSTSTGIIDGDIMNSRTGEPFKTAAGAKVASAKTPGEVVKVTGGFVVRPSRSLNVSQPAAIPPVATGADRRGVDQPNTGMDAGVGLRGEPGQAVPATPDAGAGSGKPVSPGQPADAVAVTPAASGWYTVSDGISGDGPVAESVRLIVRPDGTAAFQRDNSDVIDITNMLRAGFSPERAIAQAIGHDTTGVNVTRTGKPSIETAVAVAPEIQPVDVSNDGKPDPEQVAPNREAKPEPFEHVGLRIYPIKTKDRETGEPVSQWAVQTPDNAEREARGERQIGGDSIVSTRDEAIKTAEQESTRAKANAARRAAIDAKEKADDDAAKARAAEDADIDGFRDDRPPVVRGRVVKVLSQAIRHNGKETTRKAVIRDRVSRGATVQTVGDERRLTMPDGAYLTESQITKIGMEYAEHLIAKALPQPQSAANQPKKGATDEKVQRQEAAQEVLSAQPAQGEGQAPPSKSTTDRVDGNSRNSPPQHELDGYKVGDRVTVEGRTAGPSTIETLFTRDLPGFSDPSMIARLRTDKGGVLDVLTTELRKIGGGNEPTSQFSDLERELQAKTHKTEQDGDVGVVVGGGKVEYASLADAIEVARKAIAAGTKAVPFQIHDATGIRLGDTDKVLAEIAKPADDGQRDDFTLTGSDRTADVAAARGQTDIFSAPSAEQVSTKTSEKTGNTTKTYGGYVDGDGVSVELSIVRRADGTLFRVFAKYGDGTRNEFDASYGPGITDEQIVKAVAEPSDWEKVAAKSTADQASEKSKGDRFPSVESITGLRVGPGGTIKPKAIAPGKPLYRETDLEGLNDILRSDSQADVVGLFVSDNPDLAIGQGDNTGVQIVFRPDSLSGKEHVKPMTGELAGREYKTDVVAPRAVQEITMRASDLKSLRPAAKMALSDFDRSDLPGGLVRFTRKELSNASQPQAKTAPSKSTTESIDYKGFKRIDKDGGAFDLTDGNMTVRVEPMGSGKYQASFRGAKSSPHIQSEQGAVDWAAQYRADGSQQTGQSESTVKIPPTVDAALTEDMERQQRRVARLKREAEAPGLAMAEKASALTKVKAAETTLRKMRTTRFDAEDAAVKAVAESNADEFSQHADLFWSASNAINALITDANPKADKAEIRPYRRSDGSIGYEAVPIVSAKPKTPPPTDNKPVASANTVFTEDAAAAARAVLKKKLGQLNTGMDPELLQAGITLAGYHVEKGARTFAAYARAMVDDLGDVVKPYLLSWYMALRADPSAAKFKAEMDKASSIEDLTEADIERMLSEQPDGQKVENATAADDTATKEQPQNDSPTQGTSASVDTPLAAGPRPDGSQPESPARGATAPRRKSRRANDRGVRDQGGLFEGVDDEARDVGNSARADGISDSTAADVERGVQPVPAAPDFRAVREPGVLTRTGSWFETARRNIDLIDLALKIEQESRPATEDEQRQLARYVGFGAGEIRNNLFPVPPSYMKQREPDRLVWPDLVRDARWKPLAERIEKLPVEWQKSILQSTQYAHYTSENIIRSMWSAAQRLGFTGGRMLEPGMGIGSFAMLMPDEVHNTSKYTGIEFDGPTALIARLLSPQQNMLHDDFIKRRLPRDYFDMAIGNPPFAKTAIQADPEYAKHGFKLHDFFFAKSIDRVRPGGLLMFVTSHFTMDKQGDKARRYLADRADLLGAIRLPQTAFEDNAGTKVVTDVIFLRKRAPGEQRAGEPWMDAKTIDTKDGAAVVNEYFAAHPEMVLGQQRLSGNRDDMDRRISGLRSDGEYTVVSYDSTAEELDQKFAQAIEQLPRNAFSPLTSSDDVIRAETAKIDFDPKVKREGVIYLGDGGRLMRVESGVGKPLADSLKLSSKDESWFKGYVGIRDLVQDSRAAQLNDGDWEKALKTLNKAYDAFRKEHGPINDFRVQVRKSTDEDGNVVETPIRIYKNRRLFREDYDNAVVTQLETINEAGEIVKAPFLLGRTIGKPVAREVKSIGDALAVSLDETGKLNLDDVGRRLHISRDETIEALGDQIYLTPQGQWQLADEYLSGDVVAKLEEANEAARDDKRFLRNAKALESVQPEKLGPSQISVKLGASWVPAEFVTEFAAEIGAGKVTFDPKTESWQVQGGNERSMRRAGAEYGTAARSASELLEAALNSRSVVIKARTADKKEVTDKEATDAANEVLRKIKDKFKSWIWTDADRATTLVEQYNRRLNNIAPRRFDGSHLTLPGVSLRFKLHPHQLRAIWRQVQTGNTYLAHAVGAGKTIEMIAGGMEQKRLGLIKKPIYVVPNHMLEQFSNEFMELYPLANIMVADDENFSAERRKAFVAAATLNAPDAIVITHSAFERIGVKEETVEPIKNEILLDLETELDDTGKDDRVRRSQLQQQIEAVEQRFDRIVGAGGKDSTIKFEDIGADMVFVDEAHTYRKLDFATNQKIKGIDPNGSKRALDMYIKTRYLEKMRPGRAIVFASGTPVTNTMGELYTIMRFFAPDELDRAGIASFDGWSRQFGEAVAALEANAAGRYEVVERFAKFDNVPELMSRIRQFMDVLTSEQLGSLVKRPDIDGGKPNLVMVEPTPQLKAYMKQELMPRLEASRRWKPSKDEPFNPDPVIAITSDGRFAALDPRFFGATIDANTPTKLSTMADSIAAEYHATADNVYQSKADGKDEPVKGSAQIVFYNLGFGAQSQANRGFNARAALTKRLTDQGVRREHILWFDDADTDAKKEAMFKAMRSGQARILIGSAKKMGTGVNVQKRLSMLHYFDPPWYPSDVEQPHGRIIRQGNQNEIIRINWYATKGTYDSTMWQMVARKQRFIDQAFTGDKSVRSMDDMSEAGLYEQAAALASGDPRALQLAGLKQDIERFERLQAAHHNEQIQVRQALTYAEFGERSARARIAKYEDAAKVVGAGYFTFDSSMVGGVRQSRVGDFGQALKDEFNQKVADRALSPSSDSIKLGTIGMLPIEAIPNFEKENKPTGTFEIAVRAGDYLVTVEHSVAGLGADVDAVGLGRRVVNVINGIDTDLRRARADLESEQTDIKRLKKKLGAPFEYTQELSEKIGDLKRLEEELKAEGAADAQEAAPVGQTSQPAASTNMRQTGAPEANETDVVFSRGRPIGGMPTTAVQSAVDELTQTWANAPDVEILASMNDAPGPVLNEWKRQNSQGAAGDIEGFHWRGKVYLVAKALGTESDVARVLFHESLGHYGLRGVFGKLLNPILRQVGNARPKEMAAKAEQYGLAITIEDARAAIRKEQPSLRGQAFVDAAQKRMDADRLTAAEEVLAELAQTRPEIGFVKRAIAAIRTWLRENIPGMQSLALTDDEIVRNFILPARNFVERGKQGPDAIAAALAFSRSYQSPVWYSELARRVEQVKMNAAPVEAWNAWLRGQEQKGVKPDEIEWSGIRDWLGMQQGKVTRQQVLDYLNANGVQVQETVLSDAPTGNQRDRDTLRELGIAIEVNPEDPGIIAFSDEENPGDFMDADDLENAGYPERAVFAARRIENAGRNRTDNAKYGTYTLPGGANYREVLLTLPDKAVAADGQYSQYGDGEKWRVQSPDGSVWQNGFSSREDAQRWYAKWGNDYEGPTQYQSKHWIQPNVLAHIRLNDRTDAEGNRVLFVEEIQSDWGQEGKRKGFKVKDIDAERARLYAEGRDREAATVSIDNADKTPLAPFVTSTDKWLTLALKRVIKMAVDEGYDKVAFVNGEQSAERYDLSKQISRVEYTDKGVLVATDINGREVLRQQVAEDKIEDYIGKEAARKLLEAKPILDPGRGDINAKTRRIEGDGLKVGGEGMKAFYDRIVPTVAKDVLRKLGGGQMDSVTIGDDLIDVYNKQGALVAEGIGRDEYEGAWRGATYEGRPSSKQLTQPGFTITDKMREQAADGVPMFSRTADPREASTFTDRARDAYADLTNNAKTFNWWNNTVGTQYQKAQQDRQFKRVFDSTQEYILDVSRLANDAADRARDLLPKMENFRDVLKDLPGIDKNRTTKADVEAIGKAIFQGTLADQREYKPAELRSVFGLTDKQVDLYRQFRAAVNKSLDDLTTTIAAKMIRNAGIPPHMFRDELETGDHEALAKMVGDWVKRDPKMAGLANQVAEVSDRAKRLKAEGYAPLMRFGQYAVSIRGEAGELLEFRLFENQRLANKAAREARAAGKDAGVSVMSTQDYKLLKGINPESLELFGDLLEKAGVFDARDEVFQTYIREAIDQRSAMKRMLERHGYPGYSTDVRRVLASFLTSNARLASKNLHFTDMLEAVENIPKSRGDVRDDATNLVKYVQEPTEEAPKLRALLFAQYIGGNVASAMVNMTQSLTMTLPYLSQFGNPASAAKALASAMRQAAAGKVDGDLGEALARAEQAGVVSPQEIHHLNAEAMGTFGSNPVVQKAMFLWGSLFSLAEQFNRRAAFIAAYNMAPAGKSAYDFAVKAVEETQGIYNRGNRPNWARGAVGATLFTFKQFSVSYLEFLSRLPKREKVLALAILMLAAGAEGLPFADDLDDIIDTIAQRLGYSFNSKEQKRRFIGAVLGQGGAEFVLRGASAVPGMPIDISQRMGMANLLPGTGIFRKDVKDHMRDVVEFFGPVGGLAQNAARGELRPTAIANLGKAIDMFQTGMYRDDKGRRVVDVDAVDAAWKAIGFQPAVVAQTQMKTRMVQQDINLAKTVEAEIADSMAEARFEHDPAKLQDARDRLKDWNEKNPTDRIRIDGAQIVRRLREMRKTREERIIKSAPREMRQEVRSSLQ